MTWLTTLWCINAVMGITISGFLFVFRRRFSLAAWLCTGKNTKANTSPSVSVVIAARNEEQAVERTLLEFAALAGVSEVILVDDGSQDRTLQIARSVEGREPRVRVMEAPPLPPGWVGKTHAIHWASKRVTSDFILFTDADIHLNQLPLRDIVAQAAMEGLDHVGGNFRIEQLRVSEALTTPILGAIAFVALALSSSRYGSATGAFNLVRASAYRQMNGHLPIRDNIVDDVALARSMKSHGYHSRFVDVSPVLSVRLFRGFRGFASAVSRSAVPFLGSCPCLALMLSLLGVLLSYSLLALPFVLILSFFAPLPADIEAAEGLFWGLAGVSYFGSVLPFILAGWLHSGSRWWGLASPLGLAVMTTSVAISSIRCMFGLTVRWRGRTYAHIGRDSG